MATPKVINGTLLYDLEKRWEIVFIGPVKQGQKTLSENVRFELRIPKSTTVDDLVEFIASTFRTSAKVSMAEIFKRTRPDSNKVIKKLSDFIKPDESEKTKAKVESDFKSLTPEQQAEFIKAEYERLKKQGLIK